MRKTVVAMTMAAVLGAAVIAAPAASGAPPVSPRSSEVSPPDNLPNPLEDKRSALRQTAITGVDSCSSKPNCSNDTRLGASPSAKAREGPPFANSLHTFRGQTHRVRVASTTDSPDMGRGGGGRVNLP